MAFKLQEPIADIIAAYDDVAISRVLSEAGGRDTYDFHVALERACAAADGCTKTLYGLLSHVCSMMFVRTKGRPPFAAFWEGCSADLSAFVGDAALVFVGIVCKISNPILQSRVADVLWELRKEIRFEKKPIRFATTALDAYLQCDISYEGWYDGLGTEFWQRVADLALSVKSGRHIQRLMCKLKAVIRASAVGEKSLLVPIAELIEVTGLPNELDAEIIEALERQFESINDVGHVWDADDCLAKLLRWHKRTKNVAGYNLCLFRKGEVNRIAAEQWWKDGADPGMISGRLDMAIQCYDALPNSFRAQHGVFTIQRQVQSFSRQVQNTMCKNMRAVSSGPIDISIAVEKTRAMMQGLEESHALSRLVSLHNVCVDALKQEVLDELDQHPIMAHFPVEVFENGIVASRIEGDIPTSSTDVDDERLHYMMVRHYQLRLQYVCKAIIAPAVEVFCLEHPLSMDAVVSLTSQSSFVPPNRRLMYAKGLKSGFEGDFQTAVGLLIPQLENSIRLLLKQVSGETLHHEPKDALDKEIGLSSLLRLPEVAKLFDDALRFELLSLMGSPPNFNLRNRYAHGFIDDCDGETMLDMYVWWFVLKLVVIGAFDEPSAGGIKERLISVS